MRVLTDGQTDGTDSITSTADAGGKKKDRPLRPCLVDFLDGGVFMSLFGAVGQLKMKNNIINMIFFSYFVRPPVGGLQPSQYSPKTLNRYFLWFYMNCMFTEEI